MNVLHPVFVTPLMLFLTVTWEKLVAPDEAYEKSY
jgi:hypothetical protein